MWVFVNDSFVSIVEHDSDATLLQVRARRKVDIKNFLGKEIIPTEIIETPSADYSFRVFLPRFEVARIVSNKIAQIDYGNFKNSIEDDALHDMAAEVWQSGYRNLDSKSIWKKQKDWLNSPHKDDFL